MEPEDALPTACPHCMQSDRIVRAVDVCQDADEAALDSVDVALPAYEWWSALIAGSIAVFMLSSMSSLGEAASNVDNFVALGLTGAAMALGALGIVRTRHSKARMNSVEPIVRRYHEIALYCENCAHIHFRSRDLPPGLNPCVAWTVRDYRRRLWYACGFVKSRFPSRANTAAGRSNGEIS